MPRLHFVTPYSFEKNLGKAYNEEFEKVQDDNDWVVLMDGDSHFFTDFGQQIRAHILARPHAGMFTCITNRVGNKQQCYGGVISENSDYLYHAKLAKRLAIANRGVVKESSRIISGLLMVVQKKRWREIGGFHEKGILKVDNMFSRELLNRNLKIYIMHDIYMIHYYRFLEGGKKYRKHLQ